jgi:hypothetical protein
MRRTALLVLAATACATAETPEPVATTPTKLEAVPPKPRVFDARGFAADQLSPAECENSARQMRASRPEQGWQALVACVDRTRWPRGQFTILERLTGGFWDQDLQSRPDAPRLIAKVIALRGGDVEGDIPLAQKSRVPLFTLAAAVRQPDVYKGRWVVVRAAIKQLKANSAYVAETSLHSTSREVQVGGKYRSEYSGNTNIQAEGQSSRYGSARGSAQVNSNGRSEWSVVEQKFENEHVETGRQAIGKLAKEDPFLEPEKDFIFLARFDGVRAGDDDKPVAMLSIAGYFQPNALLIQ